MSLRDEFKNKTIPNAKDIEKQKRQVFEKEFDEFIDSQLVKGFVDWFFGLVKKDIRFNINNGYISESFFGKKKIATNELAIGPNSQFAQTHYGEYRHAFPNSLQEYFNKNSMPYWTNGGYRYKGLTFSAWFNQIKVLYIEGLFYEKVAKMLAEKLKEEPGLSVRISRMKLEGEDTSFYLTVKYKFVL